MQKIQVRSYFDGDRLHRNGPYVVEIGDGVYRRIYSGHDSEARSSDLLIPSPVESHAHLFLDGDELDSIRRADYLARPRPQLLEQARTHARRYLDAGIRTVRDAGDIHGINLALRDEFAAAGLKVIAAGHGLRKNKRYGSFFAREIETFATPIEAVKKLARDVNVIKIVLTGIIDFENGVVKGTPQFTEEETALIVRVAHDLGLKTFAHCSGLDGLRIAAAAGVDSIEHGFFMTREILEIMAAKQLAWTPTLLPVHFQWAHPGYCGWSAAAVAKLRAILDNHEARLREAESLGVPILAGSDAGSYGARHVHGLQEELNLLRRAGISEATVLRSVTSEPRRQFNLPPRPVREGAPADFSLINSSQPAPDSIDADSFLLTVK